MKAREGDFIEIKTGSIFDAKGLVHPPDKVIAFPRFIPDSFGSRKRIGYTYKKVTPFLSVSNFWSKISHCT